MKVVNIHETKTQLSRLVEEMAAGAEIVIAKAGKPIAKLVRVNSLVREKRLGTLKGRIEVPDDFNIPLDEMSYAEKSFAKAAWAATSITRTCKSDLRRRGPAARVLKMRDRHAKVSRAVLFVGGISM